MTLIGKYVGEISCSANQEYAVGIFEVCRRYVGWLVGWLGVSSYYVGGMSEQAGDMLELY